MDNTCYLLSTVLNIKLNILREIDLAIVLNGYAAVAFNRISMLHVLLAYSWFKT